MPAHPRLGGSTWGAVTATYYDTLGVQSDASFDEIRTAYRARARELHPDRFEGGVGADRQRVEQQMRAVNEAWSVLRDPLQRRQYDQMLRPFDTGASSTTRAPFDSASAWGTAPAHAADADDAAAVDVGPLWHRVVGLMPWLAILVALVVVFVFTAYALHGGFDASAKPTPDTAYALGSCVHIDPGPATSSVPCTQPNDGRIVAYAGSFSGCPAGTEARRLVRSELLLACLSRD